MRCSHAGVRENVWIMREGEQEESSSPNYMLLDINITSSLDLSRVRDHFDRFTMSGGKGNCLVELTA